MQGGSRKRGEVSRPIIRLETEIEGVLDYAKVGNKKSREAIAGFVLAKMVALEDAVVAADALVFCLASADCKCVDGNAPEWVAFDVASSRLR